MTLTIAERTMSTHVIRAVLPEPFSPRWSRLAGVTVEGNVLSIDATRYFLRYENPTWIVCAWNAVRRDLLEAIETSDVALEQRVLNYVKTHGRRTSDPAEVLAVAWRVYEYLRSGGAVR
jgi:hypothetical protein